MKELRGIIPYVVSPVSEDGKVLNRELSRLCEHLICEGVHGLCVLGSSGEFPYLSEAERFDVVSCAVETVKGRVPVVAGVSGFSSCCSIEEARRYAEIGADAILALPQAYFPLKTVHLVSYYRSLAEAVPQLPVVLYANPKYMHFDVGMDVLEQLIEYPNIRYFKDATGNTGKLLSIRNAFGDRFSLFSASAHIPLFVMMIGGVGWMAGPACVIPRQSVELFNLVQEKKYEQALALQIRLWEMNRVFAKYDLVACVKAALNHLGFSVGNPIPPQIPLNDSQFDEVAHIVDDLRML